MGVCNLTASKFDVQHRIHDFSPRLAVELVAFSNTMDFITTGTILMTNTCYWFQLGDAVLGNDPQTEIFNALSSSSVYWYLTDPKQPSIVQDRRKSTWIIDSWRLRKMLKNNDTLAPAKKTKHRHQLKTEQAHGPWLRLRSSWLCDLHLCSGEETKIFLSPADQGINKISYSLLFHPQWYLKFRKKVWRTDKKLPALWNMMEQCHIIAAIPLDDSWT